VISQTVQTLVPGYIDPGSGSIIFQAVVGGMMVVSLTAKRYWRRIQMLFRRNRGE